MSALSSLLEARQRPVVTAELPAINSGGTAKVRELLGQLAPYVDAVNATDNPAAHAHASNVAIAIAILQSGAEPVLQVVCRDKNRLAIQADIVGAALFGVENVCALTGDDVTAGDEPGARRVFDLDGPQLIQVVTGIANGHYLSGRPIDPAPPLFVGAVENPGAPPLEHRVARAKKKSEIGARFLQLQICYVVERMSDFVGGCEDQGVTARTALLPTICLTKSAKALEFMNAKVPGIHVPDEIIRRVRGASHQAEASYQLSLELARTYLEMSGVAGLHIADFRHDETVARLVEELGLTRPQGRSEETRSSSSSEPQYKEQHAHGSQLAG